MIYIGKGIIVVAMGSELTIIPFEEDRHSVLVPELTAILHSAYSRLANMGLRFLATHQPPETTLKRLKKGSSYLGFCGDELMATITLVAGGASEDCNWYSHTKVAYFTQFAVKPAYQGKKFGRQFMDFVEAQALSRGFSEIALDTSEHAHHLIEMYTARGYRFVEHVQWDEVNYRSVILSKSLIGLTSCLPTVRS